MGIDRFLPQHDGLMPSRLGIGKCYEYLPSGGAKVSYVLTEGRGYIANLETVRELIALVKPFYDRTSPEEIDNINHERIKRRQENRGKPMPGYKPPSPSGYVYLLQCGPYYKIGISTKVDERIKQLSTIPPFDLELLHTIKADDMRALEGQLHKRYAPKRKNGEWFELDDSDVEYIKGL